MSNSDLQQAMIDLNESLIGNFLILQTHQLNLPSPQVLSRRILYVSFLKTLLSELQEIYPSIEHKGLELASMVNLRDAHWADALNLGLLCAEKNLAERKYPAGYDESNMLDLIADLKLYLSYIEEFKSGRPESTEPSIIESALYDNVVDTVCALAQEEEISPDRMVDFIYMEAIADWLADQCFEQVPDDKYREDELDLNALIGEIKR